mmetsp:Transcript_26786/g.64957  ORF Transcript_26786/g.64957 Transcript_26786/m.64957 type:complete len:682 (+) Transcript_26786:157-2202(+)
MADVQRFLAKHKAVQKEFEFETHRTVAELKQHLAQLFCLQSCKIIGLRVPPKKDDTETKLGELRLKKGKVQRIQAVGPSLEEAKLIKRSDAEYEERQKVEALLEEEARKEREKQEAEERVAEMKRREEAKKREEERRKNEAERHERWTLRREEQQRRRIAEEKASEAVDGASVRLTLQCLESGRANDTDRLVLPPSALERIVDAKVPFPVVFKLSRGVDRGGGGNVRSGGGGADDDSKMDIETPSDQKLECVHASVREFTAPSMMAHVPKHILERLGAADGEILNFESILLPKAKSVSFQPNTGEWFLIDEEERKAVLEFNLRAHQFLERGGSVKVEYLGKEYVMKVKELEPDDVDAVSITDTDLSTQVVAAECPYEESSVHLETGKETTIKLLDGDYTFCSFDIEDASLVYEIQAQGSSEILRTGVDMYLSPSSDSRTPTHQRFTKASQCEGQPVIQLSDSDLAFRKGKFYIGLRARENKGEQKLMVKISQKSKLSSSSSKGYILGGGRSLAGVKRATPASSSLQEQKDDMTTNLRNESRCPNCRRMVPKARLQMHQIQCERRNAFCSACSLVLPRQHFERHKALAHSKVVCPDCGEECESQQSLVERHLVRECKLRPLRCHFCAMRVIWKDRDAHQGECGMRSCLCLKCGEQFKRREMKYHLTTVHKMNPADVSFRDYI